MGLKPDRWIRKKAQEHGMIEPFVAQQVRQVFTGDGGYRNVISFGVSSYGYDVRVADEFKIFTNVHSAVVDPKKMVSESYVDFKGEICVIPPNSFALARTVEYFRVPRNVLCVCLGKSTYARCFRGDTKVALVDGTAPTLEEMARRADNGEVFWGYSIGQFGRVMVTLLDNPRFIGRDSLLEIVLDNDAVIHCTPDHEFVTRDGQLVKADDLRPDVSLMPLYRQIARGYEMVYQPSNGYLYPTHRLADEWNVAEKVRAALGEAGSIRGAARLLGCDRSVFRRFPDIIAEFRGRSKKQENHKVYSVRSLPGDHDVYCLTVPEAGNFALEAGVFVSNCGIIVNITPFEPEWQGFVTLEISNTTPLPARIYANEGIAQVLFFEADEECEQSYADRKGKYQSQKEIVLPKV